MIDDPVVQDPVENDLQLVDGGDPARFVILECLGREYLRQEHGEADENDHADFVPAIVSCVRGTVAEEHNHEEGCDEGTEDRLIEGDR